MAIKRIKAISLVLALLWAILEMQIENPAHKSSQTECGKEFVCVCLFVCLFVCSFPLFPPFSDKEGERVKAKDLKIRFPFLRVCKQRSQLAYFN